MKRKPPPPNGPPDRGPSIFGPGGPQVLQLDPMTIIRPLLAVGGTVVEGVIAQAGQIVPVVRFASLVTPSVGETFQFVVPDPDDPTKGRGSALFQVASAGWVPNREDGGRTQVFRLFLIPAVVTDPPLEPGVYRALTAGEDPTWELVDVRRAGSDWIPDGAALDGAGLVGFRFGLATPLPLSTWAAWGDVSLVVFDPLLQPEPEEEELPPSAYRWVCDDCRDLVEGVETLTVGQPDLADGRCGACARLTAPGALAAVRIADFERIRAGETSEDGPADQPRSTPP